MKGESEIEERERQKEKRKKEKVEKKREKRKMRRSKSIDRISYIEEKEKNHLHKSFLKCIVCENARKRPRDLDDPENQ